MTDLLLAFQLYPPDHIRNFDEFNWLLVMAGDRTVPKGATGKYQPLDRCVFGALKSKGRVKWQRRFMEKCTKAIAAWDYEETLDGDDEEVESLDEGFRFDMVRESDDTGFLEMRRQPPEDESYGEEDNEEENWSTEH
jgi:hypothetical protein